MLCISMKSCHKTVLLLCLSFIVSGIIDQIYLSSFGEPDITWFPHTFLITIGVFIWCKKHAREHNIEKIGLYPLGVALLNIVVLPVYAYRHFGWRNGSVLLSKSLFALIVSFALYFFAMELTKLIYI
jgi:hypothetical protein